MSPTRLERADCRPLHEGWSLRRSEPGAWATPAALAAGEAAASFALDGVELPGTVASFARAAGRLEIEDPVSLSAFGDVEASDWWLFRRFSARVGAATLRFEGLSPGTSVWLNGEPILEAESAFLPHVVDVSGRLRSENSLHLCHRSPTARPAPRRPRARWRTALVADGGLRFRRTPLVGRLSAQGPLLPPVGAWAPIVLETRADDVAILEEVTLDPRLEGDTGRLRVALEIHSPGDGSGSEETAVESFVEVAGHVFPLHRVASADAAAATGRVRWVGEGVLPGVAPWWPHTHAPAGAAPTLHDVTLVRRAAGRDERLVLDRVGFRRIEAASGPRFALRVNDAPVFCRGMVWTPLDPVGLGEDATALRSALEQVRDAGLNMIRVPGTGLPASDAFLRICDALGILVWFDFPFATFDYPFGDPDFAARVDAEVEALLARVRGRASLAVLCGNSEGMQQPAMLGLERESWRSPFFEEELPARCAAVREDVPFRTSSPSGGALPFHLQEGTTHYFGVGAYRRPLDDVRAARPAFASECLALANVPGLSGPDGTPPERHPRDRGADWDFMDVTRHYAERLFAGKLDAVEPARAAHMLRATSAWLIEQVVARMRTPEADCGGALVLGHRDGWASAGWGVLGSDGRPKAAWYGLSRAAAPVSLSILDDGLDGLRVALANDRPDPLVGELVVTLLRRDGRVVERVGRPVEIAARGRLDASVDALVGGFRDSSHAYRFGAASFDAAVASFAVDGSDGVDETPAPAVFLVTGTGTLPSEDLGWQTRWIQAPNEAGEGVLEIDADRLAQWVVIEAEGAVPSDGFFHLAPGTPRRITLRRLADAALGSVRITALNAVAPALLVAPGDPSAESASQ